MKQVIVSAIKFALAALLVSGVSMFPISDAWAQQKQKISYKVSAANTKYTQQHTIDVGDVPGHQIRIYELHRAYPADGPRIEGVRIAETWTRASSDYIDLNGPQFGYGVYLMENGDKIFTRFELVSHSTTNADGSRKTTSTSLARITGGTGKFRGIQGSVKSVSVADIKAGINETQGEIEYWMGI